MTGLSLDSVTWRTLGVDSPYVTMLQLIIFIPGIIITLNNIRNFKDTFTKIIWSYCLMCLVVVILNNTWYDLKSFISMVFNILIIPIGISYGKYLVTNISGKQKNQIYFYIMQIPAIITGVFLIGLDFRFDSDCAFAVFLYLPFVFFIKNNIARIGFLSFYGIIVLLCAKRSVIIAYSICLIAYFIYLLYTSEPKQKNKSLKRLFFIIIMIVGAYIIVGNYGKQIEIISQRFSNMEKDKGSGREDVYADVYDGFKDSGISQQLFGHGFGAVKKKFEIGAHNDLIEIMYDYGVIPLILYLIILSKLLRYTLKKYDRGEKTGIYTSVLTMNTSIILILGMLNCMIVSTIFEFINFCALGMTLQMLKYKSKYQLRNV